MLRVYIGTMLIAASTLHTSGTSSVQSSVNDHRHPCALKASDQVNGPISFINENGCTENNMQSTTWGHG